MKVKDIGRYTLFVISAIPWVLGEMLQWAVPLVFVPTLLVHIFMKVWGYPAIPMIGKQGALLQYPVLGIMWLVLFAMSVAALMLFSSWVRKRVDRIQFTETHGLNGT